MNVCITKEERSQTNNLQVHLQEVEIEKQTKLKVSRRKEVITREKINTTKNGRTVLKINEVKIGSL
jgi:hypothetical protein